VFERAGIEGRPSVTRSWAGRAGRQEPVRRYHRIPRRLCRLCRFAPGLSGRASQRGRPSIVNERFGLAGADSLQWE